MNFEIGRLSWTGNRTPNPVAPKPAPKPNPEPNPNLTLNYKLMVQTKEENRSPDY